ncbi:hypothetical protein [Bacillus piscicola]|uniref:hypothetical protein n=1 Tax=Bacillus piscicola TaxID=1632684 RepID=UPI001F0890C2|nr:hypothetical protein [Bacillus piscicola]
MENVTVVGKLMEKFIETGRYSDYKNFEKKKDNYQKKIRSIAEEYETRRHVFEHYGTVAKFMTKPIYEWDYPSLNEYLNDIGLLPMVADINIKSIKENNAEILEIIEAFENPAEYTLGASFNKKGKELAQIQEVYLPNEGFDWYMRHFIHARSHFEAIQDEYKAIKGKAMNVLVYETKKKVEHEYGSLYLRKKPKTYDIAAILELDMFGEDFLIKYGKPNRKKLERFFLDGVLKESDLHPFRQEVDRRVDFIIMDIEKEQSMFEWFSKKTHISSRNYSRLGAM